MAPLFVWVSSSLFASNLSFRLLSQRNVFVSSKTMATFKGLVLGVYSKDNEGKTFELTNVAQKFNNSINGSLDKLIPLASGSSLKKGKCRIFYGLNDAYQSVALVGLGSLDAGFNELEEVDEKRENVRAAVAAGVRQLRDVGASVVDVDPCGDAEAAGEGGGLALYSYDELKMPSSRKLACAVNLVSDQPEATVADWNKGLVKAEGQNLARRLMETPANIMTPTQFAREATDALTSKGVSVITRNKEWATEKKMGSFLSVAKGSDEPPVFLEISYNGRKDDTKPVALVGKGITFDSGGISIKPSSGMDKMRADMGGAACVVASIYTAAALKLPVNVIGLTPLCENMPSGRANKPGDVVTAMNGKTIQVDNTDAEGRLILADALCYAHTFQPTAIVDMATLTGAMIVAIGGSATGVFTNSKTLWNLLHESGGITGDRVWRMPLFELYKRQVTECQLADLNNIGSADRAGGSCTAAAFLRLLETAKPLLPTAEVGSFSESLPLDSFGWLQEEFVTATHWAHLDIAGVMDCKDEVPYLCKGMAGRPTRTIVEFLKRVGENQPF